MTGEDVAARVHAYAWTDRKPGLERTRALLAALGNPEKALKFVHITGSNGKGSTAAMLASVLTAAGYRTGLFTSPHLYRFNERFQVNGAPIPGAALDRLAERVLAAADTLPEHPTEFELMTAIGFLWFAEAGCDLVVVEVGLGGRLDSTNVIPAPEAAVITNIGLEHTALLGDTLQKIAAEKAGIIKSIRGAQGGYMLDKDPKDISAGDILRTLEGDLTPIDCAAFTGDTSTCSGTKFCVTKTVWKRINDSVQQAVDSITLQELMEESIEIHTKYDQEER